MSNVTTIVWPQATGQDRNGFALRKNGADVKGRIPKRPATIAKIIEMLESAIENLETTDCTFWACDGPKRPQHMVTCSRCWGIRDLQRAIRHLKAIAEGK